MTTQLPYILINEYEDLDFGSLLLRAVATRSTPAPRRCGDPPYRHRAQPNPGPGAYRYPMMQPCLPVYRIDASARISLAGFEYHQEPGRARDIVDEAMPGDYWLCLSELESCALAPVQGGRVLPRDEWFFEMRRRHYLRGRDLKPGQWPPPTLRESAELARPCALIVRGEGDLVLAEYKLYVDREIASTSRFFADRAPDNGLYLALAAGSHRMTLREWDATKLAREASNTVYFDLLAGQAVEVVARRVDGALRLDFVA